MNSNFIRPTLIGLRQLRPSQLVGVAALTGLDLVIKFYVERGLGTLGASIPIFPGLNLTLGHNRGVSFGLLDSSFWLTPVLLACVAVVLVAFALGWTARQKSKLVNAAGLFFAAGGFANAIDRLGDGAVTDYLDFGLHAIRWPTFNLADVFVFCGVMLLLAGWKLRPQASQEVEQ
ncbi:signal peptidase II [Maricaulis sp.]|uniref:signal peptidase II n=1 Tax=Maricaulis sp. TaxID=1486257 RepID=UPI003A935CF5